jgi:hypothetical protein
VRNGSDVPGLASTVAGRMRELDFAPGTVDNTDPSETSVVRYTGPDGDAARAVAEQLGGIEVESVDDVTRGHLLVVLGGDFDPAVLPAPAEADPAPATADAAAPPDEAITAAGVPCID